MIPLKVAQVTTLFGAAQAMTRFLAAAARINSFITRVTAMMLSRTSILLIKLSS